MEVGPTLALRIDFKQRPDSLGLKGRKWRGKSSLAAHLHGSGSSGSVIGGDDSVWRCPGAALKATCSRRDEMVVRRANRVSYRNVLSAGIVGRLEIDLWAAFASSPASQLNCGPELLHQDGDLHAAVPDLRQS